MIANDASSLFSDDATEHRLVTGAEAADLLDHCDNTSQLNRAPEKIVRAALRQNLLHDRFRTKTVGFLRRYRFWDPIIAGDKILPSFSEIDTGSSVPLGVLIEGAAEVVAPESVNFDLVALPQSHANKLSFPTSRDAESEDFIDTILVPGDPIGLFEAMDSLLYSLDEKQHYGIKQRDYCVFSGSRTLYPCIPFGNAMLPKQWVSIEKRQQLVKQFADYNSLNLSRATDVLTKEGVLEKTKLSSDQFFRLLLSSFAPTPWSTYILYFGKEFFHDSMKRKQGREISRIAWSRMSQLESSRVLINRLNIGGPRYIADQLIEDSANVASGNKWCLVPISQSSPICNGTDMGNNHIDICNESDKLKNDDLPLLMVPGYLSSPGDWGIIPLKNLKKSLERERSWFQRLERHFNRYCDSPSEEAFDVSYLSSLADLESDNLLYAAAKRQSGGAAANSKFLFPSILVRLK